MSILKSISNFQEYGNNPKNGYMDDVFLDLIQQKQRLGKALTQEDQEFLDNRKNNDDDQLWQIDGWANALAVVGSELARTGEKDRLILANSRPRGKR